MLTANLESVLTHLGLSVHHSLTAYVEGGGSCRYEDWSDGEVSFLVRSIEMGDNSYSVLYAPMWSESPEAVARVREIVEEVANFITPEHGGN